MLNPDSLLELSCQERLIWLEETAEAERPEGAAGKVGLPAWTGAAKKRFTRPIPTSIRLRTRRVSPGRRGWLGVNLRSILIDGLGGIIIFVG
jgi:hypothetical protein